MSSVKNTYICKINNECIGNNKSTYNHNKILAQIYNIFAVCLFEKVYK